MNTRKLSSIIAAVFGCLLALTLVACSGASSYGHELLEEASGIRVTAENASDNSAITTGAIEVKEGDAIVISPFLEKGCIHVTITSSDGQTVVYDDDVDGKVLFTTGAVPGTYDVETTGKKKATGWMTIFAQNQDEMAEQDAALEDVLVINGVESDEITSK